MSKKDLTKLTDYQLQVLADQIIKLRIAGEAMMYGEDISKLWQRVWREAGRRCKQRSAKEDA